MGAGAEILGRVKPSPFYSLAAVLSWPVLRWLYRLRDQGTENLPSEGGYVLAANHTSNFDPWPLGLPIWPENFLRFMAKSELYWWPLSAVASAAGAFRVQRGAGDTEAIRTAVELVREGEIVVMFPEGTRRKKGVRKRRQARAHTGAARIAQLAGAPLVPAAIKGTDRLSRLGKLQVVYGDAFEPGDDTRAATERLMNEIETLYESL
jgi:1-acyl-sn-glycerol-3-phosphate acyltransferase